MVGGRDARRAGVTLLAAAALLPLLPGSPGLPCPLRTLTGIPCPLCGMTTSVEATVRLQLLDAAAATPAGIVLVMAAALVLVRRPRQVRVPGPLVAVALGAMWVFQLLRFGWL